MEMCLITHITKLFGEYQLSNEDDNVKQLRKKYDIPTKGTKLILKGDGILKVHL